MVSVSHQRVASHTIGRTDPEDVYTFVRRGVVVMQEQA